MVFRVVNMRTHTHTQTCKCVPCLSPLVVVCLVWPQTKSGEQVVNLAYE